jgi:Uma2 family endonuclease
MEALKREPKDYFTYENYVKWEEYPRCELIDGEIHMMSSPSREHQAISIALSSLFWNFLRGKPCQVYSAPFDVRINADDADDTVLQPDIIVVCDEKKLENGKCCEGAPDLAVEILSPSNTRLETYKKFIKYRDAKVREYWVVEPEGQFVTVYTLRDNEYVVHVYQAQAGETIPVAVLEGLEIKLDEIFPEIIEG